MRMKTLLAGTVAAAALAVALTGCSSNAGASTSAPSSSHSTSAAAAPSSTVLTGAFSGLNGKKVTGDVTIDGDTVTLSGFSSDQGPDLHLYLTNGTSESDVASGLEFSKVAYNQAAQTYTLPSGTDPSMYTELLVHCDKAKAVFGAAQLSQ